MKKKQKQNPMIPSKTTIIGTLILLVVGYIIFLNLRLNHAKVKAEDYESLVESANTLAKRYIDADGRSHLRDHVEVIQNPRHLKQDSLIIALTKDIARLKHVQSVSHTILETRTTLPFRLRDSVAVTRDTLKCINVSDGYTSVTGCLGDTIHIASRDTVDQVVFVQRKYKFLFIKFGKKTYTSDITPRNPNSRIVANRTLVIKR